MKRAGGTGVEGEHQGPYSEDPGSKLGLGGSEATKGMADYANLEGQWIRELGGGFWYIPVSDVTLEELEI